MRMPVTTLALAAAVLAGPAARAQVDLSSAGGSSVHVGPGGDVHIRSAGGDSVSVRHGATTLRAGGREGGRGGGGCPGGRLAVSGSGARLQVAGPCREVEVSGSRNTVRVGLAAGARVTVSGSHNTVVWTPADPHGAPPRVEAAGTANAVRRG
jgi:hypothetical protein